MAAGSVTVKGLRELIRACDRAGKETKKQVRSRLRKVGEIVRDESRSRFSDIDAGSAAGYGVTVRAAGSVSVEQRRRRVTGLRGDYGALQMRRALVPALGSKSSEIEREFNDALDDIANIFERG